MLHFRRFLRWAPHLPARCADRRGAVFSMQKSEKSCDLMIFDEKVLPFVEEMYIIYAAIFFAEGKVRGMTVSFKPLFKLLIDKNMKKKELAEISGVSVATITKMGKDGASVNSNVLGRICNALSCKFDDILEILPGSAKKKARKARKKAEKQQRSEAIAGSVKSDGMQGC